MPNYPDSTNPHSAPLKGALARSITQADIDRSCQLGSLLRVCRDAAQLLAEDCEAGSRHVCPAHALHHTLELAEKMWSD